MIDKKRFEATYEKEVAEQVTSRLDANKLADLRTQAVSGAGFSVAIIFLLFQTDMSKPAHEASLWCAALAIPAWIACWQMVESYFFVGEDSYGHFSKLSASLVAMLTFLVALLLVASSMILLLWTIRKGVAVSFVLACLVMVVHVYRYHNAVRKFANEVRAKREAR